MQKHVCLLWIHDLLSKRSFRFIYMLFKVMFVSYRICSIVCCLSAEWINFLFFMYDYCGNYFHFQTKNVTSQWNHCFEIPWQFHTRADEQRLWKQSRFHGAFKTNFGWQISISAALFLQAAPRHESMAVNTIWANTVSHECCQAHSGWKQSSREPTSEQAVQWVLWSNV